MRRQSGGFTLRGCHAPRPSRNVGLPRRGHRALSKAPEGATVAAMVAPPWMAQSALRPEVIRGYREAPPNMVAEILPGELRLMPRPRPAHAEKMPIYARERVAHAWLVDPEQRTLEVFRRGRGLWVVAAMYRDDAVVKAEPFDALALELGALWRP